MTVVLAPFSRPGAFEEGIGDKNVRPCVASRFSVPAEYEEGYKRARKLNRTVADRYIRHVLIGDPVVDQILAEMDNLPQDQVQRFMQAGMELDNDGLRSAPRLLRDFFHNEAVREPSWLDRDALHSGIRAFQKNSIDILASVVAGSLVKGFSTTISKSFVLTGRVLEKGVRRLKQNNRHQLEIFLPGGLDREGEGWKLSVRIRFVHGRVRRLLSKSQDWNLGEWGTPINAANLGFAAASFSALTVKYSEKLGVNWSTEERRGFHAVWRYAAFLMGIPDSILFKDEDEALELIRIGTQCEPPPTEDSIVMANTLLNSAPLVAGITDPDEREKLVTNVIYPVSRSLVGKDLSNQLQFPLTGGVPFPLLAYRLERCFSKLKERLGFANSGAFMELFKISAYDDAGISYRLPDRIESDRASYW